VVTDGDRLIGNGLVNYNADEIRAIMGLKTGQIKTAWARKPTSEVIHRDNLAITGGEPEARLVCPAILSKEERHGY
jgi:glutamate 5-kinase